MGNVKKFKKMNGEKQNQQGKTTEEMRNDPDMIQVYDEYGREMFIDRATWRKDILPGTIEANRDKPDDLYGIIVGALEDGFYEDVIEAAQHLHKIDPVKVRSSCILGIVFMKLGRLNEAEEVLTGYLNEYGEEGVILTNIAKVQAERGQDDLSEKTLWHALEVDPNQDNAVGWWGAIHYEHSGDTGYSEALEKAATIEGSWRPQLWLARVSLGKQDYKKARHYYDEIIAKLDIIPPEVMMQISGDLGNAGRLTDIVELLGHCFNPELHGLMAGNNLIKAYLELHEPEKARDILLQLYELNRPDWKEHLRYWEDQIDRQTGNYGPVDDKSQISIATLTLAWPVWAHKLSSFEKLLPSKEDKASIVAFISATCEYQNTPGQAVQQKTDKEGTLSRSIPLFFSEQVHMTTNAKSIMLVPVISGEGSFIMSAQPWDNDTLINLASGTGADYIISGHLTAHGKQWRYQATLVNVAQRAVIDELSHGISEIDPGMDVIGLAAKVKEMLDIHCGSKKHTAPIDYHLPDTGLFSMYLDGTSQSLALSVAVGGDSGGKALYGERAIFDYLLELALNATSSDVARLMFISALAKNRAYGSAIYNEYKKKAEKLLKDHPLSGIAAEAVGETIRKLFSL